MPDLPWPEWLTDVLGPDLATWVIGALVVTVMMRRIWKKLRPWLDASKQFLRDWAGEPERPGISSRRLGVMERLKVQDDEIAGIRAQVTPNHGSSAHDSLMRRIDRNSRHIRVLAEGLGIDLPEDEEG